MKTRLMIGLAGSLCMAACTSSGGGQGQDAGGVNDAAISGDAGRSDAGRSDAGGDNDGGVAHGCVNIAGTYAGTEAIGANSCRITPHPFSPSPTLKIVQVADSCRFTMTNSFLADEHVSCAGTIDPKTNHATWRVTPSPYVENNGYTTVTTTSLTITPAAAPAPITLNGSFEWQWATSATAAPRCGGTTTISNYIRQ